MSHRLVRRDIQSARQKARKLGIGKSSRTILLCVDRKEAGCASARQMSDSWKHLKHALKKRHVSKRGGLLRLKMQCCGICKGGPIAVVMPDQIWYGHCTPDVLDRIVDEHLIQGQPVREYVIAKPDWAS